MSKFRLWQYVIEEVLNIIKYTINHDHLSAFIVPNSRALIEVEELGAL